MIKAVLKGVLHCGNNYMRYHCHTTKKSLIKSLPNTLVGISGRLQQTTASGMLDDILSFKADKNYWFIKGTHSKHFNTWYSKGCWIRGRRGLGWLLRD